MTNDTPADAPVLPALGAETPLTWLFTASGAPLVIGNVPNVIDRVRAEQGWSVWYLVASKKTIEHFDGGVIGGKHFKAQDLEVEQPKVFKVVDNIVGWSVHEAPQELMGLVPVEQSAMFNLPKIPWPLVQRCDNFFRRVHDDLRTEAIVILTYNPNVGGSEGWGVVVPDQTNSAGHCAYEHDSIVDAKDDDAFVVGTAHSHPLMSAFASGTDHHDQADFDGLHITFGWMPNKNQGATEFHLEMQMAGKNWMLKPEDIFLDIPEGVKFPEVEDWRKQVKAAPTTPPVTTTPTSGRTTPTPGAGYGTGFGYLHAHTEAAKLYKVPTGFPDPKDNLLVLELTSADEEKCPACDAVLDRKSLDFRRCVTCWNFLAMPGEDLDAIVAVRKAQNIDLWDLGSKNDKKLIKLVVRTEGGIVVTDLDTYPPEVLEGIGATPPLEQTHTGGTAT